jgi:hypothetical protein
VSLARKVGTLWSHSVSLCGKGSGWYNGGVPGGMAEWSNAAVLKTADAQVSGGSNPSPSVFSPGPSRRGTPQRGIHVPRCFFMHPRHYLAVDLHREGCRAVPQPFRAQDD